MEEPDRESVRKEMVRQFTEHIENQTLDESVIRVKLVILGPTNSGKTSWVKRVTDDTFSATTEPTVGAEFSTIDVAVEEKEYQFDIWDVSGEEWCRSLCPMYLQHANAVVVCFDKSDSDSFVEAKEWVEFVKSQMDRDCILSMVGAKDDLNRVAELPVNDAEVIAFCREKDVENKFLFPAVSSRSGESAQDVILTLAEAFHDRGVKEPRSSIRDGDKEFDNLVSKSNALFSFSNGNENPLPPLDQEASRLAKFKRNFTIFTTKVKEMTSKAFEKSKDGAQKGYEITRTKSRHAAKSVSNRSNQMLTKAVGGSKTFIRKVKSMRDTTVTVNVDEDRDSDIQEERLNVDMKDTL